MGMLSRAMKQKRSKQDMLDELDEKSKTIKDLQRDISFHEMAAAQCIKLPSDLIEGLKEMVAERGVELDIFLETRLRAIYHAYTFKKVFRLDTIMPYGRYKNMLVEHIIRSDPRYVSYLASESDIFILDEEATQLLKELS